MKYIVLKWMQAHVLLHYSAVAWLPPSSHVFSGRSRIIASGYGNTRRPLVPGSAPVDKSIAASSSSDSSSRTNVFTTKATSAAPRAASTAAPTTVGPLEACRQAPMRVSHHTLQAYSSAGICAAAKDIGACLRYKEMMKKKRNNNNANANATSSAASPTPPTVLPRSLPPPPLNRALMLV